VKFTTDNTVQTTAGIPLSAKAVSGATYVATLGVDGKLDATQIPSSLTGAIVFKGTWNATTNRTTIGNYQLSDTTPTGLLTGWEYIVDVGGTVNIGDGSKTFLAGDFVIFDGTHWKQVPSGNAFISLTNGGHITVNQSTGAMTLGSDATPNTTNSTIVSRDASGNFAANVITASLSGSVTGNVTGNVSGNAGTVTNGVYTNGSYANPAWITSLAASKVGLGSVENTALSTSTHYVGTTSIQYNRASASQSLTGVSIDGNAGTVTNGVVTTGSYSDPSWLTISKSKVGLSAVENTALSTWAGSSNITTVGSLTNLTIATGGTITTPRVVINAGGIRTVNSGTALTIDFATDTYILWTAPSGTAAVTLQNYTAGARVKLMIAMTTSRDVTYGISAAANSSTGADNFNGAGGGSVSIANTTMFLDYVCMSGVAGGCYVSVNVL
jgi:hypothetical protein